MTFNRIAIISALMVLAAAGLGCSSNPSSPSATTTTTPTTTAINDVVSGTVPVPVDGVLQSSMNTFTTNQAGATAITMTSAVEKLPDGTLFPTVTMGLAVGTFADNTCTLVTGAFVTTSGGSSPQIAGTNVAAGSYCVLVSDVTNQLGPVQYALVISHY